MKAKKQTGIWMDHSVAHLMELKNNEIAASTIKSKFTHQEKEHSLSRGENNMHNKEQHEQADYYKNISNAIKNYDEVILFGPTKAKNELANLLKADRHFENLKIEVKDTDKMSESEQQNFVKEHFHSLLK
jgi:stalled ribosome rescue protein Dom34